MTKYWKFMGIEYQKVGLVSLITLFKMPIYQRVGDLIKIMFFPVIKKGNQNA